MGKINIAWRQAMALVGKNFTQAEHDAGWPETLKPAQLAALQYPHAQGDKVKHFLAESRYNDILSASKAGQLPSTATTKTVTPTLPPLQRPSRSPYGEPSIQNGKISFRAQPDDVTTYWVTSSAFATWLATQDEPPSEHIAAWFKANDANSQPEAVHVLASTPTTVTTRTTKRRDQLTPLVEAAQKACDNAHDAAAVFLMLKTWAQEDKPRAPLVGVTEDGRIQWRDSNDTPKELNRKSLAKRLKSRSKPPATTPQVKPLRLIK
jgi:hypothetical protein